MGSARTGDSRTAITTVPREMSPYPDEGAEGCKSDKSPPGPTKCDNTAAGSHADFKGDKYKRVQCCRFTVRQRRRRGGEDPAHDHGGRALLRRPSRFWRTARISTDYAGGDLSAKTTGYISYGQARRRPRRQDRRVGFSADDGADSPRTGRNTGRSRTRGTPTGARRASSASSAARTSAASRTRCGLAVRRHGHTCVPPAASTRPTLLVKKHTHQPASRSQSARPVQ